MRPGTHRQDRVPRAGEGRRGMQEPRVLGDLFLRHPGNAPFLVDPERGITLTYARFVDEVNAACMGFQKCGVRSGDAAGIVMPNGVEVLIAFFGALHAGAAAMPINPDLTPEEIDFALEDSRATLVITTPGSASRIEACRSLPERRAVLRFDPRTGTSVEGPAVAGSRAHAEVRP